MRDITIRLTRPQAEAVLSMLVETLAGSPYERAEATGQSKAHAVREWDCAVRAKSRIADALYDAAIQEVDRG